ncbi:MAG: hypothetical protein V3S14_10760, partial [Anaerolineae bacterium]
HLDPAKSQRVYLLMVDNSNLRAPYVVDGQWSPSLVREGGSEGLSAPVDGRTLVPLPQAKATLQGS